MKYKTAYLIVSLCITIFPSFAQNPVEFIEKGNLKEIAKFVESGGELATEYQYTNKEGEKSAGYLLAFAYAMEEPEIFRYLNENVKKLPNYKVQLGNCLTNAINKMDSLAIDSLLSLGADVNVPCNICHGTYPIQMAASMGDSALVKRLLSLEARTDISYDGHNLLSYAIMGQMRWFFEELLNLGMKTSPENFLLACSSDDLWFLDYLIKNKDDIANFPKSETDWPQIAEGEHPYFYAASASLNNLLKLKELQYNLNGYPYHIRDSVGYDLLCYASLDGKEEIVKWCMENGADAWFWATDDWTPLEIATDFNCYNCVKYMLEVNVPKEHDPRDIDYTLKMAIKIAKENKNEKISAMLKEFENQRKKQSSKE